MKKIIILSVLILSVLYIPKVFAENEKLGFTNENGVYISSESYKRLINLGFTDEEIANMDSIKYENNKDIDSHLLAKKTVYIKTTEYFLNTMPSALHGTLPIRVEEKYLSKENFFRELNQSKENNNSSTNEFASSAVDSYKSMTVTISDKGTSGGYRVKNSLVWYKMPAIRDYDLLEIEVDNAVKIEKTDRAGQQSWKLCNGSDCYKGQQNYDYNSTAWQGDKDLHQLILKPNLKNDEWDGLKKYSVTELSLYIYGDLSKVNDNLNIKLINAIGTYSHDRKINTDVMTANLEANVNW